ncbi:hypothetical protein VTN31DRAFT_1409 [Thermomyces dupontii]|uniref:uncharacterized protein n=1 Tax=Talaromyces thermophilus TaxID=28565 RepID=UPI00374499BF
MSEPDNTPSRRSHDGFHQSESGNRDQNERSSTSQDSTNPDVFSDDFSLERYNTSDTSHDNDSSRNSSTSSSDSHSTSQTCSPLASRPSQPETAPAENPFDDNSRIPSDEDSGSTRPSSVRKVLHRQSSVTTSSTTSRAGYAPVPRPMSPYRGATGPSHPYGMYPQIGVSRSSSVRSTSTVRPYDAPPPGGSAPQHPYALYQQNIGLEQDIGDQIIPMGFPPNGFQLQHACGQADDVGDIIGPDGHLEQLPPYSRYPEGVRPKSGHSPASIASAMRDREQSLQAGPAASSGESSRTLVDTSSLAERDRSVDRSSDISGPVPFNEKVKQKGRQKCCGAPLWLLALLGLGMVVGGIIGGVIGGLLGEKTGEKRSKEKLSAESPTTSVVTITYTSDVTPLSTFPTDVPPLPTGRFRVPTKVHAQSKFCAAYSYVSSWNCQNLEALDIEIQGTLPSAYAKLSPPVIDGSFTYGAQAPFLSQPSHSLHMMLDKDEPDLGPTLFFSSIYDKLVIVPEDELTSSSSYGKKKRSFDGLGAFNDWRQRKKAQAGEQPWFCWWNSTAMEFFLYVNETVGDDFPITSTPAVANLLPTLADDTPTPPITSGPEATHDPRSLERRGDHTPYPRRIKIEEKRAIAKAPQAYCEQMKVQDDNTVVGPISSFRIVIDEITPGALIDDDDDLLRKRDDDDDEDSYDEICYCEWVSD